MKIARIAASLFVLFLFHSCDKVTDATPNQTGKISISSAAVSAVTFNSAITGGTVNSDGGSEVIERGVCYATTPYPTISNIRVRAGTGLGSYQVTLQGLTPETKYFVRAYAYSAKDTSYGEHLEFTTASLLPTVNTNTISAITTANAQASSEVVSIGASALTQRGVCWSTTTNPTIANDKTTDGTTIGSYNSNIIGLKQNTRYYVRAYATNSYGTAYGKELTFITPMPTTEDLHQIQFLDNNIGFIAGNKVIIKTINGGDTWTKIRESSTINFTSIRFENENLGYAGGNDQYYAYIFKTTDGGLNWTQVTRFWNGNERLKVTKIFTYGASKVSCLVNSYPNASQISGSMYFSSDAGSNWVKTSASKIVGFNCGDINSAGIVYIGSSKYWAGVTYNVAVFTSTFFSTASTSLTEKIIDVYADMNGMDINGTKGYAVGSEGRYFTSGDGGVNWTMRSIAGYSAEIFADVNFRDNVKGFIVGTNGLLLRTTDGGLSWFKEPTNTTEILRSLAVKPDGTVFAVGDKGEIFRKVL
ncbi:MAG: WD40/YVTN/BNR-like repeat-containing protein [Sphingobacteriales bacterium]|jgi:photosystem II stability/assembly factor-like uncharacterized protein